MYAFTGTLSSPDQANRYSRLLSVALLERIWCTGKRLHIADLAAICKFFVTQVNGYLYFYKAVEIMEFLNFSENEIAKVRKSLTFIAKNELDLTEIPSELPVVKSENYLTDCEQFIDPERTIGMENDKGTVIFPNNRTSKHKLFLNKDKINGISYIHSLTSELVVLGNFSKFFNYNGHLYTFTPEKILEKYYYEFLLWVKFLSRKISTRTFTLMSWHEVNGEAPPPDGRYQFEGININRKGVSRSLEALAGCDNVPALRELYWDVLSELSCYFGELSFYQAEPKPPLVDEKFPEQALDQWLGLDNVLNMYELLQKTAGYAQWSRTAKPLRETIIRMEKQCKQAFTESGRE